MIAALPENIRRRISVDRNTGCWLWAGSKMAGRYARGYGIIQIKEGERTKSVTVHRLVFRLLRGEVRYGLELDHLCRVRSCCNPDHLEHIEQGRYGHPAKKATWLYAHGIGEPPAIDCRVVADRDSRSQVSWCGNHTSKFDKRPRVGKRVASSTPAPFRELLISIARSAVQHER